MQSRIFAIVVDDTLYFKVGDANRADYEVAGALSFTYESRGKRVKISYWRVPDEVLEDEDQLRIWAEKAWQVII